MSRYYAEKLAGGRLKQVYQCASPRVVQYLQAEIDTCLCRIKAGDRILETGCGYGRALKEFARKAKTAVGIDNAWESLDWGKQNEDWPANLQASTSDATVLPFRNGTFDLTFCIQNGISAFHTDPVVLLHEMLRVTRTGGAALLSSYAEAFWDDRLDWFRTQAELGLLGKIDETSTRNGVIVCEGGFKARTYSRLDFLALSKRLGVKAQITEIDGSSLFCEIKLK